MERIPDFYWVVRSAIIWAREIDDGEVLKPFVIIEFAL
jgi:hypothetical protein